MRCILGCRAGELGRGALSLAMILVGVTTLLLFPARWAAAQDEEAVGADALLRVVHASPGAPEVDVLIDGQPLAQSVPSGTATGYASLPPGEHQLQVVPAGQTADAAVLDQNLDAESGVAYLFIALGLLNEIEGEVFEVNLDEIEQGESRVRLIQASPDAGEVDIAVTGGDTLFDNVDFGSATDYESVAPGAYSLDLRGDEDRVLATAPDLTLRDARVYDLIALGQVSEQSLALLPLETTVSPSCVEVLGLEGSLEDACLRLVHAAPDTPAVDVYVGDSPIVQELEFGGATEYVDLPSGDDRAVQVVAAGTALDEAVIDTTLGFDAGQAYEIVVTGEGDDLELTTTGTDLRPLPVDQARLRVIHASPDAGAVDIGFAEGPTPFEDVDFRDATDYAVVDTGEYSIEVRPAGEDSVALALDVELAAGTSYDAIALGRADDQTLTLLILVSPSGIYEDGLATTGAEVMTTPGAVGTVTPAATPDTVADAEPMVETSESTATPST